MTVNPIRFVHIALVLAAVGFGTFIVLRAIPPHGITIETGPVGGSYYETALKYRDELERRGIHVNIVAKDDSLGIIADVNNPDDSVDVGFTAQAVRKEQYPHTAAAAAIELQPLFVFYNIGELGQLETLTNLRGKRLVMPPEQSATTGTALQVLKLYGVTPANTRIEFLPLADGMRALQAGRFDAGLFMLAPSNALILDLVRNDNLRLLGFSDAQAIVRRMPFLNDTTLPRGAYNIEDNVPPENVELIAATVNVVVRKDIHPAVLYTLLDAMSAVHHGPTLVSRSGEFPSFTNTDLLPHPLAVEYAKSGVPWVYRNLPLPFASLIDSYLIVGIAIFIATEIYKSSKYLGELTNFLLENVCVRVLARIARRARAGRPVGPIRLFIVRVVERALFRTNKRKRSEELIGHIRSYADPGR